MATRLDRLRRVEAVRKPPSGGVITFREGETPEQAAERAVAVGRRGPFLAVPAAMSVEAWSAGVAGLAGYQARCEAEWRAADALKRASGER